MKVTRQTPSRALTRTLLVSAVLGVGLLALSPSATLREQVTALAGLTAVVAILYGVRRYRPSSPAAWHLLAAAQATWLVTRSPSLWDSLLPVGTRSASLSASLSLLGYPFLIAGIALLVKGRTGIRRDLGTLLETATATAGAGLLIWTLLARPATEQLHDTPWRVLVTVSYLAVGIVVLGALFQMITSPGKPSLGLRDLLLALALTCVADTVLVGANLVGTGHPALVPSLWLVGSITWGAAALHPSMAEIADPVPNAGLRVRGTRLLGVVLASLIAPLLLAAHQVTDLPVDVWAAIIGSVTIFMLIIARMVMAIDQITNAHEALETLQDELAVQANHDSLTGLPNRAQAMRLLARALGRARRTRARVGLLFIDLDGFKAINDEFGHRIGDEVLRQVAERLRATIRDGDFAARLGGDEFVVGIEDVSDDDRSATALATRLIAAISQPITAPGEGVVVQLGASVGIAVGRGGETDVETLLHEADLAVYRAKNNGRGRVDVFTDEARAALKKHTDIERALLRAITADELVLHYQPIVTVADGRIEGFEALMRWDRPGTGLVAPGEFLPVAESSDLICDLDQWAMRTALAQLSEWNEQRGVRDLHVAVNISGRHIGKHRILADVADALLHSGVDAGQLVIEITETALMDGTAAAANLAALRNAGVVISLDDFGTGYHSNAQLSRLPIDLLKIDKHFVDVTSPSDLSLLELMIKAAHAYGLRVVAEGIERQDQLDLVRSLGCQSAQGYFLGRPAPAQPMHLEPEPSAAAG